ncbi:ArsR/SmtB family transcription factor [Fimbriiglobus ruber]|uniref:HTH arsR-type domain-containing protein n=1 Tax=Fimbriiglobus ruber TaxID=1908690 RepID=A0A225E276_9BACT|nr:metalloregulator ArsR/SmtB family transcription factor [Fimbriiglobus ruber]OWK47343.1 hypothetical protein FRUB_01042 [Fimbriiglobus ruber]
MTDYTQAERCAGLFHALAEPTRIRIIDALRTGRKPVIDLARLLHTETVNISHHLSVLRQVGLVRGEKYGRYVEYALRPDYFSDDATMALDFGWCRVEIVTAA